jgi:predicted permease
MLELVWHALSGVLALCVIVCVGYALAVRGWFTEDSRRLLPRLVMTATLPPFLFSTILNNLSRDELFHLVYGLAVPALSVSGTLCAAVITGRLIRLAKPRRGPFYVAFTFSNTIFIGVPVNYALFGEISLPYVLIYYFANTTLFWTVGHYLIAASGEREPAPVCSVSTLKQIFSPPMIAFLIGVLLVATDTGVPAFLRDAARYLGNVTTPIILISLGATIQAMRLRNVRISKELTFVLLGRFLVCPLSVFLLSCCIPLPDLMRRVFIIQASLPAMASLPLLSSYYKADEEFSATAVVATTLLSIITIPGFMVLGTIM